MMKKQFKKLLSLIFSGVILTNAVCLNSFADEPYNVYNYDTWKEAIPSQAGYIADRAISGEDLGTVHFNSPSDMFRSHEDIFYIADSGNNRIVAVNSDFSEIEEIYDEFTMADGSKTTLSNPTGIYVSPERDWLYIADNENARVLVSDYDANVIMEITKPTSEIYQQDRTFLPQKVISDKAGNIYVVLGNITTGAAMFNPKGEFTGFYGANRAQATADIIINSVKNLFLTEEKKARQSRNVPSGITNFDLDDEGFIFTCTQSTTQSTDIVKKLNSAGKNIFASMEVVFGDFTPMYDTNTNTSFKTMINDIDIGDDGSINCLDLTTGRVFQYDKDCNLMFIFGTKANQVGGFIQVSALETMGQNVYVLDSMKATVTIFTETSFGEIVHEATNLYNAGYYDDALEPWYEVLKRDGNYRRAYIGIASALLNKGEYSESMRYAKLADAGNIYNKAFEGWRAEFIQEYFMALIIGAVVIIVALWWIMRKINIKRTAKLAEKRALEDKIIKEKEEQHQ